MNRDNKALKEITESVILVEYLLHHGLVSDDFNDPSWNDLKHFTAKYVKKAMQWKQFENDQD